MKRIIKYCESQYNVANTSNTLQLGTFDYYREKDPSFSIADAKEGYIHYLGPEKPITIDAEQFNSIMGGALQVSDNTTAGKPIPTHPGGTHIKLSGHKMIFGNDGFRAELDGDLDVKLFYPNAYLFCTSIIEDGEEPDPKKVSNDYNSWYEIKIKTIGNFIGYISNLLMAQLTLNDFKLDKALDKFPLSGLKHQFQVICMHQEVKYVDEKEIRLNDPNDFTENRFYEIYRESIFKKEQKYSADKEYRFAFFFAHPSLGFLSVKTEPKILELKPMSQYVDSAT